MTEYPTELSAVREASVDIENSGLNVYPQRTRQAASKHPLYAMLEYSCGLNFGTKILAYTSIQTIQQLATDSKLL